MVLTNFRSVRSDAPEFLAVLAKRRSDHLDSLFGESLSDKTGRTEKIGIIGDQKSLVKAVLVCVTHQVGGSRY